ncbi:MAG: Trm112 family protein [Candidatus Dadabacteria bacterium]|nr:MAG: Trm112 family protein [Candidatus Dadabacteria bacterium]
MAISKELLDILVCPACKGPVKPTPQQDALICEACKLRYPIEDDIPVMIVSEAKPLE